MFEEIAFVWLVPTDLTGWHSTNVQTIDVWGGDETVYEVLIVCDSRNDEAWPESLRDLVRSDFNDTRKGKHKLAIRKCVLSVIASHNCGQDKFAPFKVNYSITRTNLCRDFSCACFEQALID